MAILDIDFTSPDVQYFSDLKDNNFFTLDANNFINALGRNNLNSLGNVSLLDIFLSREKVVEPHYHQNASELVYCITGSVLVSLINPFTTELSEITLAPGQVANVPQGWWHYEIAQEDNTHLLAIFDAPYPQAIFGSDILRLTPNNVLAHTYCLDEGKVEEALAPIQSTTVIGPSDDCNQPRQWQYTQPQARHQHPRQYPSHPYQQGYVQYPHHSPIQPHNPNPYR
ncbi:cupin domain-containing protein [Alkalicoccobacillus murimartini]|uniref:Quercetin dioxygenase-like cupin family protein n=1 Tax=Alkalicoccobacillus murimartini TaxID=171685 RepID=A0ABT9YLG0_9BACI|nr:cupin domain-containing protein [Alkalicoccobacillus murimartini]MDQ0208717.1 quercetin dioxygenase-like cupin family protein [Alkalicoccobacillus murimartini]